MVASSNLKIILFVGVDVVDHLQYVFLRYHTLATVTFTFKCLIYQ